MLSSKDVRSAAFDKAVFGGYDVPQVDALLEEIAGDYDAMRRENEELRGKMKVLIEKIEEYRRVENGIRQALVTAQGTAKKTLEKARTESERILSEAKQKAENMVAEAGRHREQIIRQYQAQTVQEHARMALAKRECAEFIETMTRLFCEETRKIAEISQRSGNQLELPEGGAVSEVLKGHIETPPEPESRKPEMAEVDDLPDDILRIFANAPHAARRKGLEIHPYSIEVTGSEE